MPHRFTAHLHRRHRGVIAIGGLAVTGAIGIFGGVSADDAAELVEERSVYAGPSTPTKVALDHVRTLAPPPGSPAPTGSATRSTRATPPEPEFAVDATARSEHSGFTHVYVQQRLGGIDIVGANASVAVRDDGVVVHDPHRLIPIDAAQAGAAADALSEPISPVVAADAAIAALGRSATEPLEAIGAPRGPQREQLISGGGVALDPIGVRLVHVEHDKELTLAWEVRIDVIGGDHLEFMIAADDGRELRRTSYTIRHHADPAGTFTDRDDRPVDGDGPIAAVSPTLAEPALGAVSDGTSYRVYPLPVESPEFGVSAIVTEPADDIASPFGWHDVDGLPGAESTLTTGNNVDAYLDQNGDNVADPGSRPDGGVGLDFDVPYDDTEPPDRASNRDAAVINLFYANNMAHDFFYAHGFDEASGNFQQNNYGRGGSGGDPVRAEALDRYAQAPSSTNRNNANFSTPPDGFPGRMQMYGWTLTNPERGSSLDNGIVLHEYAHGWSVRLTGGRNQVTCLNNQEQMGEGWSDWAALMATIEPGDTAVDPRGIGIWALGQDAGDRGIRSHPYSTSMSIDPRTYDSIASASVPHGVGSIWAAMLWDVAWALIDRHGFDPDLVNGDGGNNLAVRLVTDGLKLQPCSPGFVDGRDAIIRADQLANGGENECLIWEAFAKRGLGWGADQGSSGSSTDGSSSFALPPQCPLDVSVEASTDAAEVGDTVAFTLRLENVGGDTETDVEVNVDVAPGLTVDPADAACDVSAAVTFDESGGTFALGTIPAGSAISCTFDATVTSAVPPGGLLLDAGFESGLDPFQAVRDDGDRDWTRTTSESSSGGASAAATNPAGPDQTSDQSLVIGEPIAIGACATLEFMHRYDTESNYDGGVVEIQVGDGNWIDLGPSMTSNGYNQAISTTFTNSAISGRPAFAGDSGGYIRTLVDLSDHLGSEAFLRFRYVSDLAVDSAGWWIDEIEVSESGGAAVRASATSARGRENVAVSCVPISDIGSTPPTTAPPTSTNTPDADPPPTDQPPVSIPPPRPDLGSGAISQDALEPASRMGRRTVGG